MEHAGSLAADWLCRPQTDPCLVHCLLTGMDEISCDFKSLFPTRESMCMRLMPLVLHVDGGPSPRFDYSIAFLLSFLLVKTLKQQLARSAVAVQEFFLLEIGMQV